MKLYAIGIYRDSPGADGERKKINSAQVSKPSLFDSHPNDFVNLEKSLENIPEMKANDFRYEKSDNENHYFWKSSQENFVIAIASRDKLETTEVCRLMRNIRLAHLSPSLKTGLDAILKNPLRYIASDIQIDAIQGKIAETSKIMQQNIEKAIHRGESLQTLEEKTITLKDTAKIFHKKAQDKNRCYGWC